MPRPLVEDAGPAWHAGSVQRRCLFASNQNGRVRVGDRVLVWELASKPFGVIVAEKGQGGPYRVLLATTRLPSGGWRWWWWCPGCGRRCDLLFLLSGGLRLACRKCGGFAYASQRSRAAGTPRTRRTRSTVNVTRTVEHTVEWGVPTKRTTLTLADAAQP